MEKFFNKIVPFLFLTFWLPFLVYASAQNSKFSIGKSVLKRDILAYSFGQGTRKILILGGIHGDESSAVDICWKFVDYFSRNPEKIPPNIKIFIIPILNPDGFYLHARLNANGVDLNRNFPTSNWQEKIYVLKATLPFGGGSHRVSEPETKALIDFMLKERPFLTIGYHSRAGFIYPELSDKLGIKLAKRFEKGSGIRTLVEDWSKTNYKVTGSLAQWLSESLKLHIFVIENKRKYVLPLWEQKANLKGLLYILEYLSGLKALPK